jgi:hypothetical protein
MKKTIGVLCFAISLASLGWQVAQNVMMVNPDSSLVDVGYLRVSEGSVIEFKNGTTTHVSGPGRGPGRHSIELPLKRKIDVGFYMASSAGCLLAAIALLKQEKA